MYPSYSKLVSVSFMTDSFQGSLSISIYHIPFITSCSRFREKERGMVGTWRPPTTTVVVLLGSVLLSISVYMLQ